MADANAMNAELPIGSIGRRSLGWWGVVALIATEAALFSYLIFSYLYLAVQVGPNWGSNIPPSLSYGIPMTVLLVANSLTMWLAEKAATRAAWPTLVASMTLSLIFVIGFIVFEVSDWFSESFTPQTSAYGSAFFVLTGFHLAHCVAGAAMIVEVIIWALLGYIDESRSVPVMVAAAYWHFTDAVWILLFVLLFVVPNVR
ncbi:MAG: heme-copper oxidase subunit III [Candidatus Binataceae bacterium]|nr:heme-copper oxidase subunit III [Candidatus Binataceae bacterium]